MFKGYFTCNRTSYIKARIAQSVQRQATNLKVVGSSPSLDDKTVSFVFCRFRSDPGRSAGPIQMKLSMTFIRINRCIERMVI